MPRDVVEAAILDDTPLWKIILRIKLPLVRPAIVMLVFINTIGALQLFVEPYILNNYQAGVVSNTWTPVIDIYSTAILAMAILARCGDGGGLALVIIAISVTSLTFRNRRREFG